MKRIEGGPQAIDCPILKHALQRAEKKALNRMTEVPVGYYGYNNDYGGTLVGKGTGEGDDRCSKCKKKIRVTYTAPKADIVDFDGKTPIKAFVFLNAKETVQVGGAQCLEEK